ncbi:MAG: HAD family hydrolase, partial [Polyangiaceae bacterium]|nr:HAD family hydrolase [Polyangiaceae bacterium]
VGDVDDVDIIDVTERTDALDDGDSDGSNAADSRSAARRSDTGAVLLISATVAGVLAIALALTGTGSLALTIRLVIACVGAALLIVRSIIAPADPADPHPVALLASVAASSVLAIWALAVEHAIADEAAVLTGLIVVSTATSMQLVVQAKRKSIAWLAAMRHSLDAPARRITATGYSIVASGSVRPGEEVVVDSGEIAPVDAVITAGEATVLPWWGAMSATRKVPGDHLVAGSRIISGRLRATATWTGFDRAWTCSSVDPHRAAHILAPTARHARHVVERWAVASAALAGIAASINGLTTPYIILAIVAGHAAIASIATGAAPSVHILKGVISALERGVSYRNAQSWDHSAQTTIAVFSARETLLLGEPQVAEIVGIGNTTKQRILEIASGAESVAHDSIAVAVRRAAADLGLVADAVRSPNVVPGLGITAVTSTGESLSVGSRALMMRDHISMASIETQLAKIETMGRIVLLVAVGGKLIGFIALQDGLRLGARAAVQHLLDGGVEPVLMSGDARETTEAIARSLGIEHVRPETLPADRALDVRAMTESGAVVAVIGRLGRDEDALDAAGVSVALDAAGAASGDWSIALASDDVREASGALIGAKRVRAVARVALVLGLAPSIASTLAIAFGLLPPAYAPLAVLVGAVMIHLHLRAVDPSQQDGPVG